MTSIFLYASTSLDLVFTLLTRFLLIGWLTCVVPARSSEKRSVRVPCV